MPKLCCNRKDIQKNTHTHKNITLWRGKQNKTRYSYTRHLKPDQTGATVIREQSRHNSACSVEVFQSVTKQNKKYSKKKGKKVF